MNIHLDHDKPQPMRPESVRMPAELREYLRGEARKNTRSFSGEVVHRLEATRQADQQPTTPKENS